MPTPNIDDLTLRKLNQLLRAPKTGDDLANRLNVSRRTLHRYLRALSELGSPIATTFERPTKYFLMHQHKK